MGAMMTTLSSTMLTLPKRRMTWALAELTTSKKYYHYYPYTASLNSFFYSNIFLENKCIVNLKLRLMCVFQPLFKFILCCKHKNVSKENKSKCGSSQKKKKKKKKKMVKIKKKKKKKKKKKS